MESTHKSYWNHTAREASFDKLSASINVDVAIVGGGIVGITTARLLKDSGLSVAVVEAGKVGQQATGNSTAKVTSQHGLIYQTLVDKFSEDDAQLYAEAQQQGLETIRKLVAEHSINCSLESASAYIYAPDKTSMEAIEKEEKITQALGLPSSLVKETDLPFAIEGALRFDDQLRFHPTRYVTGLAKTLPGDSCHVFENSPVVSWESDHVETANGRVNAKYIIMATHLPLGLTGGYFSRAFPNAEPVIAARLKQAPADMYLSAGSPSYSFNSYRTENGDVYAVVTGSSFKPGEESDQKDRFNELETWLRQHFEVISVEHRWTNEDYISMDSVPYVGRSSFGGDYFIATGFAGWGLTNSTASAIMLRDLITGRDNPWLELFDAKRIKPIAGGGKLLKESAGVLKEFSKGRFSHNDEALDRLKVGEGMVVNFEGDKLAVARDKSGHLHQVSAVCTHLGCIVGWNEIEQTWDCGCHGSRFTTDGNPIHGPAVEPLPKK